MVSEAIFSFTKQFQKGMEILIKRDSLSDEKKAKIQKNLQLVSEFNKLEFSKDRYKEIFQQIKRL